MLRCCCEGLAASAACIRWPVALAERSLAGRRPARTGNPPAPHREGSKEEEQESRIRRRSQKQAGPQYSTRRISRNLYIFRLLVFSCFFLFPIKGGEDEVSKLRAGG
mmetsp:Transcript_22514/g.36265  ORF Transcript_22514/g.36265 Transcript_22514/m.36265 type:complete len:107 (-) Transcript_22514:1708-2028(-)